MKLILSLSLMGLIFGTLPAMAGHEVNNGTMEAWYCQGVGHLQGNVGSVILPFEMRISPKSVELTIMTEAKTVVRTEKVVLSSTAVNYGNGAAELRSYKPSTTLMKDLVAYITISDIGKIMQTPHNGTVDFSLENGVRFYANAMACNNYF